MGILDSIKSFFGSVFAELKNVPHDAQVIVSGVTHAIEDTERSILSPVTDTVKTFAYPWYFIAGAAGLFIIYEVGQTSRAALPYMPSIIESGAKVAPLFGRI